MEADDRQPRARAQHLGGFRKKRIERLEFPVDPDPKGLKGSCRRVDALIALAGHGASHNLCELTRRPHIGLASRTDDRTSNASRESLFAELEDDIGERTLIDVAQEVGCGWSLCTVHTHVEWLVAPEAEAAPVSAELKRRDAEIRQRAVDPVDRTVHEDAAQIAIVGVNELDAFAPALERRSRRGQCVGIAIEAKHLRRPGFEQRATVAAESNGAVHVKSAPLGSQQVDDFARHHGNVLGGSHDTQMPN
jgi:hypothetical protein